MIAPLDQWISERTGLGDALDAEIMLQWQLDRLRSTIVYARSNSRAYAVKLQGLNPDSIRRYSDLETLPFTTPAEVAADPVAFLCVSQSDVARSTTITTSGTSGTRKRVFFTADDLERTVDFFDHGMRPMVESGQRTLILMSGETEHSIGRLLQTGLARFGVAATIIRPEWSALDAVTAARDADCIVGIPSQIHYLCRTDPSLRPQSVLLSADYIPQPVIAALEETWCCRVYTHYGMTETGFGCAVQCDARQGQHVRSTDILIEIVDPVTGRQQRHGEPGEIVLTMLRNQAMPLIRYRTGDRSQLVVGTCGCGSRLVRLGKVAGRYESDICLVSGKVVSIHQLDNALYAVPGVRAVTARLDRKGNHELLHLTIDAEEKLDQEIASAMKPIGVGYTVAYDTSNPFPFQGKRRLLVSYN